MTTNSAPLCWKTTNAFRHRSAFACWPRAFSTFAAPVKRTTISSNAPVRRSGRLTVPGYEQSTNASSPNENTLLEPAGLRAVHRHPQTPVPVCRHRPGNRRRSRAVVDFQVELSLVFPRACTWGAPNRVTYSGTAGVVCAFCASRRRHPCPVLPTRHLVVKGSYRYVRNPMYLAVVSVILGQGYDPWEREPPSIWRDCLARAFICLFWLTRNQLYEGRLGMNTALFVRMCLGAYVV